VTAAVRRSLTDSYNFKLGGLIKKTINVTVQDVTLHLISHYRMEDIKEGLLQPPSQAPVLTGIRSQTELISKQGFRVPLGEAGYIVGPPMVGSFIQQLRAPQMPPREGQYGEFNQSTYRGYNSLNITMPQTSHSNSVSHPGLPAAQFLADRSILLLILDLALVVLRDRLAWPRHLALLDIDGRRLAWVFLTKQEYTRRCSVAKKRSSPKLIPTIPFYLLGLAYSFDVYSVPR
jgi:Gti1/Pac2 family